MITLNSIAIYEKYGGNGDGFIRCATAEERLLMDYRCWVLLDEFVQDLIIVKRGLASDSFIKSLNERLRTSCDNETTIQALMVMAERSN